MLNLKGVYWSRIIVCTDISQPHKVVFGPVLLGFLHDNARLTEFGLFSVTLVLLPPLLGSFKLRKLWKLLSMNTNGDRTILLG
jgi:hypothetical protein